MYSTMLGAVKLILIAGGLTFYTFQLAGQGLANIPPVLFGLDNHQVDTGISFILTPSNTLEIIDAQQPWPPRWFAGNGRYVSPEDKNDSIRNYYENARLQQGYISFYKDWTIRKPVESLQKTDGYIICNRKMEAVDTIRTSDIPLNAHDFRINEKGEKLLLGKLDTVLDISTLSGSADDTAKKALVDIIEILDRNKEVIFRWNAVEGLGVNSEYYNYGGLQSRSSLPGYTDWSHANSVQWDFDGNILYGFRSIGVGKISRADGHVIWRIDRNKMPYRALSDSIAFFMQHGFDKVSDHAESTTYVLFSNGDFEHKYSYGLMFSVQKQNAGIDLVKNKNPVAKVISRLGGNYEIEPDGNYILSYGGDIGDTSQTRIFFEYGNKYDQIYATYRSNMPCVSYDVHQLNGWRPPRPEIVRNGYKLIAKGVMKEWIWYKLSGKDYTEVKQVGEGKTFLPQNSGVYCVAGKYGMGYAVSYPFLLKR